MKKLTVDFPVIGWASVEVEVEDNVTADDFLDAILNDEVDVEWDGQTHMGLQPVLNIYEIGNLGEIPAEIEVSE